MPKLHMVLSGVVFSGRCALKSVSNGWQINIKYPFSNYVINVNGFPKVFLNL